MTPPDAPSGEAPTPSAAELLAEVAKRVAEKKAAGDYDPAEMQRVEAAAVDFAAAPAEDGYQAELALHLDHLRELWDPQAFGVTTHRAGTAGRLIVAVKRLVHRLTAPLTAIWLARQVRFNDHLVKLLLNLLPRHHDLRHRMGHNEGRLDALEEQARAAAVSLADQGRQLHAGLDGLGDRAARNERGLGELGRRLEGLEREAGTRQGRLEELLARLEALVNAQAAAGALPAAAARAVAAERQAGRAAAYLAFEDLHRGSREEIKRRQEVYLPVFRDQATPATPLLDLGCGRGEFLELCRDHGLPARGVDLNPEMAALCRDLGLAVEAGDALELLRGLPDGSLGGILAAQLIEHLSLDQLTELVSLAAAKLAPGAALVAETVNPQCLTVFSGAFYLDLTHIKPIHPEAARFLWRWAGLNPVEIMYLSPYPPDHRLELFPAAAPGDELAQNYNRNMDRLNQLLYGHQDYAVVGRR